MSNSISLSIFFFISQLHTLDGTNRCHPSPSTGTVGVCGRVLTDPGRSPNQCVTVETGVGSGNPQGT